MAWGPSIRVWSYMIAAESRRKTQAHAEAVICGTGMDERTPAHQEYSGNPKLAKCCQDPCNGAGSFCCGPSDEER